MCVEAYEKAAEEFNYPLHLGITEAGNNTPSSFPPAIPISASLASPGPFTPTSHYSYCYI